MTYLTVSEVADLARRHPKTVSKDLRSGKLHGTQSHGRNSNWRVKDVCAEAWIENRPCPHREKPPVSLDDHRMQGPRIRP